MPEETKAPENEMKAPESETPPAAGEKVVTLTEAKYQELTGQVATLTASLTAATTELSEAKKTIESQASDITSLKAAGTEAVTAYRRLAVSSNPVFTDELITGSTIAEVDASIAKVVDLAGKIKSKVEAELKAFTIPAGVPERSGPDTSGLSPREKIKQGIEENKK